MKLTNQKLPSRYRFLVWCYSDQLLSEKNQSQRWFHQIHIELTQGKLNALLGIIKHFAESLQSLYRFCFFNLQFPPITTVLISIRLSFSFWFTFHFLVKPGRLTFHLVKLDRFTKYLVFCLWCMCAWICTDRFATQQPSTSYFPNIPSPKWRRKLTIYDTWSDVSVDYFFLPSFFYHFHQSPINHCRYLWP